MSAEDDRRRRLVTTWTRERSLAACARTYVLGLAYQSTCGFAYALATPVGRVALIGALLSGLNTLANAAGLVLVRRRQVDASLDLMLAIDVVTLARDAIALSLLGASAPPGAAVALSFSLLIVATFAIPWSPAVGVRLHLLAGAVILAYLPYAVAGPNLPVVHVYRIAVPFTVAIGIWFRRNVHRFEERSHELEYERLRQVTPPAVIDAVIADPALVGTTFAPEARRCVCICADWRGYQTMTAGMVDAQVVRALEHYYDEIDRLLEASFPRGNYFSDWIADELFVVCFSLATGDDRVMLEEALRFGESLVLARPRIAARHGAPLALDVGLSTGVASVGIMGSKRHRKATALGEVPGRSRRLQTAGKHLRAVLGERDRVIVDAAIREAMGANRTFGALAFTADVQLRDLDDRRLYFLEPTPPS